MNTIKKYGILIRRLRDAEHFDFFKYNTELINAHLPALEAIKPLCQSLCQLFAKEDKIFKRSRKAEETQLIRTTYRRTRNEFMIIKHTVTAAAYSNDPALKAVANTLEFVLRNFKTLPSTPMNETSALVAGLVQDLRQPKNAAAVAILQLSAQVGKLEASNETFRQLYAARAQEHEASAEQGNMRSIRPQVDKSFVLFTRTLAGLYATARATGTPARVAALKEIIDGINAIILQYDHIYARRHTPGSEIEP
ncbi:MAG: DUF6261 family protein [Tannerellaceae bacterium]|jgi:hypothetical protein|nr:DUF6261 family protein [Tannerellaceae bacterium]